MGSGASAKPDESALLPPPPDYDLPLWNEHSKGKLLGRQRKKNGVSGHLKHQRKVFTPYLPSVRDKIAAFKAENEKAMEAYGPMMRFMVGGVAVEEVTIDGNAMLGAARGSLLRPDYTYDNSALKALLARPKGAAGALPGLVYAHGGGVATTAKNWDWCGKAWAKELKAVVLIVDFRHGGEAEAPAGALDLLAALKWLATADGVDAQRISLMGNSGGGYEASVLCLELAARGEAARVKTAFLDVPTIFPDDMLGPYDGWSDWKRFEHEVVMKQQVMCIAGSDWEAHWAEKAVWLRALAAPEELLRAAPPHVVISVEFDMHRWQQDDYVARLQAAGVLKDYVLLPGANHMDANPFTASFLKIYKQAFQLYGSLGGAVCSG